MKKPGISRRKFLIGSAVGGASILASSYLSFDAWATTEKLFKISGSLQLYAMAVVTGAP